LLIIEIKYSINITHSAKQLDLKGKKKEKNGMKGFAVGKGMIIHGGFHFNFKFVLSHQDGGVGFNGALTTGKDSCQKKDGDLETNIK